MARNPRNDAAEPRWELFVSMLLRTFLSRRIHGSYDFVPVLRLPV